MVTTVTIGGKDWPVTVPANPLDAVIAATSLSVSEFAASLSEWTIAGTIASFLRVFLGADAPAVADLASLLDADLKADRLAVLGWVLSLAKDIEAPTAPLSNETPAPIDAAQDQEPTP